MPDAVVLWLPLPDNRANARFGHWANEYKAQQRYYAECDTRRAMQRVRPSAAGPPARARVAIEFRRASAAHFNDHDNLHARCKWICDYLAGAGLIRSDAPDALALHVTQDLRDGTEPAMCSVRVTVTPLEP